MSSGLTARRLILQQLTAVTQHIPLQARRTSGKGWWLSSFVRPEGDRRVFTLITEEEVAFLKRRCEEEGDEGRVILSTRPTRNIVRAVGGAALNITLSFLVSPLLALSVSLEAIRLRGLRPAALVIAPGVGLFWGAVFMAIAWYAAVQQMLLCGVHTLRAPIFYLFCPGCCWNELSCRYEYPSGVVGNSHPLLSLQAPPEKLFERAMKRETRRKRRGKRDVGYERKGGTHPSEGDDYYAILGVTRDATPQQIKEAYNRLALEIHPDRNPSQSAASQFDVLTKAYRVLGNAEKRRKYDMGGRSGVEDMGKKKRGAVRALFGGDALYAIVGDVKTGSFSQRVIDGLDWTQEELAIFRQRTLERCRDELLSVYLQPLRSEKDSKGAPALQELKGRLQRLLNTGLAREVLHAVGHEYMRVVLYGKASGPRERMTLYLNEAGPHRMRRRLDKWRHLCRIRQHTLRDSATMVDLAWYTSVEELESTARWVATSLLLDHQVPEEERRQRLEALQALAEIFITYGQSYKGANKQTMDALMNSLRDYYQQQKRGEGG
ncbi:chaperone protein DNAj, putative [Trypanosoma equiperdum]|uniref:Chaperone protein DNAj, putative n=1 Tax=Trypanosoma equiperdum TaxID=5694 RepID=A0A1G4I2L8_TRYEQ|nr:chaperone protein DNAj, putative [Trypanosoma equiperdum]